MMNHMQKQAELADYHDRGGICDNCHVSYGEGKLIVSQCEIYRCPNRHCRHMVSVVEITNARQASTALAALRADLEREIRYSHWTEDQKRIFSLALKWLDERMSSNGVPISAETTDAERISKAPQADG